MRRRTIAAVSLVCVVAMACGVASAQAGLEFEVASVRRVQFTQEEALARFHENQRMSVATHRMPVPASVAPVISGSRVDMDGIVMKDLIARAYSEDPARIATADAALGPRISQVKYVIRAIMPEGATKTQLPEMLRSLLETRFHLEAKRAATEQPVYALVAAKTGVKFGAPREIDRNVCPEWRNDPVFSGAQICVAEQGKAIVTIKTDSPYGPWQSSLENNVFRTEFFRITMPQLADYLTARFSHGAYNFSQEAAVPVVDRTGVDGAWDLVLDRTDTDPNTYAVINYEESARDSFSASLGKVGLKLERTKVPFEQLIVERVDMNPTEN